MLGHASVQYTQHDSQGGSKQSCDLFTTVTVATCFTLHCKVKPSFDAVGWVA